jgi:YHS domain-containing protein
MVVLRVAPGTITLAAVPDMFILDPACGKKLELDRAAAQADHEGWAYFFCTLPCQQHFTANPGRFVGAEIIRRYGEP